MSNRTGKGKHACIVSWEKGGNGATQTHTFFHDNKTYVKQQAKDWAFHNLTPTEWKRSRLIGP